jgi:hypothetical protein
VTEDKEKVAKMHLQMIETLKNNLSHVLAYANGSQKKLHNTLQVGVAVAVYHNGNITCTAKLGLRACTKAFDREMAALNMAAHLVTNFTSDHSKVKHLHFFADNTNAVTTIFKLKACPNQLYQHSFYTTICSFLDQNKENTVKIT